MPEIKRTEGGEFKLDYSDMISPTEDVRRQVIAAIANDTEGKVRRVLIELGWTPPPEKQ